VHFTAKANARKGCLPSLHTLERDSVARGFTRTSELCRDARPQRMRLAKASRERLCSTRGLDGSSLPRHGPPRRRQKARACGFAHVLSDAKHVR
jgi:hypothetical protein